MIAEQLGEAEVTPLWWQIQETPHSNAMRCLETPYKTSMLTPPCVFDDRANSAHTGQRLEAIWQVRPNEVHKGHNRQNGQKSPIRRIKLIRQIKEVMQSTWRYITDERNVETAIRRAYSRKSARQKRRKEVRDAMNDPEYAHRLAEDIKNGTYRHGWYRHLTIHEIKDRDLSISSYYDRCCQNVLKDAIQPIMVNKCTDDMCAGMPNRGISSRTARWNVIKKMRNIMRKERWKWYVAIDIVKCYDNINNIVAMKAIEGFVKHKGTLRLCREHVMAMEGLPVGDPWSHDIENIVLAKLVRHLKEETGCEALVNYADNIIMFGRTKEEVAGYLKAAKHFVHTLRLHIHRTYPTPIKDDQPIVFCGRKYYRNKVLLRNWTKKRYIKARHKKRSLPAYQGVLESCDCGHLKKIVEVNDNGRARKSA